MSKTNLPKIYKEIEKSTEEELPELFSQIKSFVSAKLLAKSEEYAELAEKFIQFSNDVKK